MRWLDGWSESAAGWKSRLGAGLAEHGAALAFAVLFVVAAIFGGPRAWRALRTLHRVRRVREGRVSSGDATLLYTRMLDVSTPPWFSKARLVHSARVRRIPSR